MKKEGISLIVLVITIIVMIILAGSVVVTLSNTGIIGKANEAVESTNIKEIEQLASLIWSEEFLDGKRGEDLETAVIDRLQDYKDKYSIIVTDKGVTVETGALYKLSGTWKFKNEITVDIDVKQEINVTCGEKNYTSIELLNGCIHYHTSSAMSNDTDHVYNPSFGGVNGGSNWSGEEYMTINFGSTPQPVSVDFYNWFVANASR